jgi:hypothetical protein
MLGTFNKIPFEVFAMKISPRTTVLRVLGSPTPELEKQFALKSRASVKVSMYEFRGNVVRYDRAVPAGIKGKNSQDYPLAISREAVLRCDHRPTTQ